MNIKSYFKIIYRFVKRHIKSFIIAYIILFFPCAYLMTSSTTQLQAKDYNKTFMSTLDSGIINVLSGGFYKPALNGSYFLLGSVEKSMGDSFKIKSQNRLIKAKSWSELGQEDNQEKSDTMIFKTLKKVSIINEEDELKVESSPQHFDYFKYPDYVLDLGLANLDFKDFNKKPHFSKDSIKVKISYNDIKKNQSNKPDINEQVKIQNDKVLIPKRGNQHEMAQMYRRSFLLSPEFGGTEDLNNVETVTLPFVQGQDGKGGVNKVNNDVKHYLSHNKDREVAYEIKPHRSNKNHKLINYVIINVMSDNEQLNQTYQVFNEVRGWEINHSNGQFKMKERN